MTKTKIIELWKNDCEHCEAVEPIINELEQEGLVFERYNIETPEGEKVWRSYTKEIDENNQKMGYELGYIYTPTIINPKTRQLKAYRDRAPKKEGIKYKVGKAELKDTGMGGALQENGLAKVLTDESGEKILGVHIIGPKASVLIHEAIVAMKANGTIKAITDSVYIHPALPEWLQRAFFAIE